MYFAVFYSTDGTIHLWPSDDKKACEAKLLKMLRDPRVYERCARTTIIKREVKDGDSFIFGSPASLNMLTKLKKSSKKKTVHKKSIKKGGKKHATKK